MCVSSPVCTSKQKARPGHALSSPTYLHRDDQHLLVGVASRVRGMVRGGLRVRGRVVRGQRGVAAGGGGGGGGCEEVAERVGGVLQQPVAAVCQTAGGGGGGGRGGGGGGGFGLVGLRPSPLLLFLLPFLLLVMLLRVLPLSLSLSLLLLLRLLRYPHTRITPPPPPPSLSSEGRVFDIPQVHPQAPQGEVKREERCGHIGDQEGALEVQVVVDPLCEHGGA